MNEIRPSTGRTGHSDRTQVNGYGRSVSGKVTAANELHDKRVAWDNAFNQRYLAKDKRELLGNYATPQGISTKLTAYCLNADHPIGKNKALVFDRALGYNIHNASELQSQIESGIKRYRAESKGNKGHGDKFDVVMLVNGANGSVQPVITSWIYDSPDNTPRMVTAYVHDKLRRP